MGGDVDGAGLQIAAWTFTTSNIDGGLFMTYWRIWSASAVPAIRLSTATLAREGLGSRSRSLKRFFSSSLTTPARLVVRFGAERSANGLWRAAASMERIATRVAGAK
jgi:hypothetical protein